MKGKTIQIFACSQCPYYIFDDASIKKRWGKPWCNVINKRVPQNSISKKCTLSDKEVNLIEDIEYVEE